MTLRLAVIVIIAGAVAGARTPSGSLGALLLPNSTRPAVIAASGEFTVEAQQRGDLRLIGEAAEFPLSPEWKDTPGGHTRAEVVAPGGMPAGAYALEWTSGDEADRNIRAVYVIAPPETQNPFSQQYAFACVSVDATSGESTVIADVAQRIDDAQAQFAVVFVRGPEDRFPGIVAALDACATPTVVIADAPESACRRWFGPATFSFSYGPDTFIAPASGRAGIGDEIGSVTGTIAKLRHDAKTSRWTVGLFSEAGARLSMRNEITLFVDDTLHACIYGSADGKDRTDAPKAWAGWFEPPLHFAVIKDRATLFAVNRKEVALVKQGQR
ncbi:MAG: hypothetical protein HUU46_09695 [Candidatus Hydrogenedentes bacterium]|nr:hypothetical protein [Candidatus Hydrogenedentota bacterium]